MAEGDVSQERLEELKAALSAASEHMGELLEELSVEYDQLSENQILSLALIGLHSRMRQVRDGRMFISVPVQSVEFFRSPLEVLLLNSDPAYAEVFDTLNLSE